MFLIILFLILCSLNVSSVLGDVFMLMCTVSGVKIKRFYGKLNSLHARAVIEPEPEFSGYSFGLFQSSRVRSAGQE